MSKPQPHDVIHSFDLIKQIIREATDAGEGSCGGDCANCPCSGEAPKSTKKTQDQESSDACDKC